MKRHQLLMYVSACALAIGCVHALSGCDRVAYEAKNSKVGKIIGDKYRDLTRLPLEGQIAACRKEEKYELCMINAGYRHNPAWYAYMKEVAMDLMFGPFKHNTSVEAVWRDQSAIDQFDAIPTGSKRPPYWVKVEDCVPNFELKCGP